MRGMSKRRKLIMELSRRSELTPLLDAVDLVKKSATAKFDESVDIAMCLGVDPRKSNQIVRGAVLLPHGIGRTVRVAVFAQGAKAEEALQAGADIVGFDDLAAKVKQGFLEFDVVIATPDAMRVVGQLGQVLGPRGLMPAPKVGTVTQDVAVAVKEAKFGKVQYKTDRAGVVHGTIGRASFSAESLKENVLVFVDAIEKARPATAKGTYISRIFLTSTMGISVRVDPAKLQ